MQKKLMVVPMKGQFEQQCNAAALKDMGIPVIKSLKAKNLSEIEQAKITLAIADYALQHLSKSDF
jgi:hypothetical protein